MNDLSIKSLPELGMRLPSAVGQTVHQMPPGVPVVAQWKWIPLGTMRLQVQSLASLSGLRIQDCCELWCRSQTRFGSHMAVAVVQAGSYSSNSTPSLATSICRRFGPKKTKDKTQTNKQKSSPLLKESLQFLKCRCSHQGLSHRCGNAKHRCGGKWTKNENQVVLLTRYELVPAQT